MRKKTCMVLLKWYFVHASKTLGRWGSVVEARSCQWQHPTVSLFCIVLDVTRYHCTILSGYNYGFEEPVDYILIWRSQRASSRGPGCCMISPINPFGVWNRKTRISHGILQSQAFSNDFVSNVKPSSKITIKSMLMYEICGFCSCCIVAIASWSTLPC